MTPALLGSPDAGSPLSMETPPCIANGAAAAQTTIITTNYANMAPLVSVTGDGGRLREETLGDRIGERMRSRLQEMCVVVEMQGQDFRQKVKRASFA